MRWTYLNTERRLSNQDRLSPSEYSVGVLRKLQIDRDVVVAILLVDVERVQPDLIKGGKHGHVAYVEYRWLEG